MNEVDFKHVVFFNSSSASRFSAFSSKSHALEAEGRALVELALHKKPLIKQLFREMPEHQDIFIYNTSNAQPVGTRSNYVVPVPGMEAMGVHDLSANQIGFLKERGAVVVANQKIKGMSRVSQLGLDHRQPDMGRAWQMADVLGEQPTEAMGAGVRIGIVDTGIDLSHPEFKKLDVHAVRVRGHRTELVSKTMGDPLDHGTSVASLIAGRRLGFSPGAKVAVCDVFEDNEGARPLDILRAIEWLKKGAFNNSGVDIINISLGILGYSDIFRDSIEAALHFDKILFVAAIGNDRDKTGLCATPGCYSDVLSVGAYDRSATAAVFSSVGRVRPSDPEQPDIWAPGVQVYAAKTNGAYDAIDGTSFASPIVAAVAARVIAANPALRRKPQEVIAAIMASAVKNPRLPCCGVMLRAPV
jgi:Subtilase family